MFIVAMLSDGTLVTIDNFGQWIPLEWIVGEGWDLTNVAAVPEGAIILAEMLPADTIDAYLADVTTGLPVLTEQTA